MSAHSLGIFRETPFTKINSISLLTSQIFSPSK
jgi:hypothetical protein